MCSVEAVTCPGCGRVFPEGERVASKEAFEEKVAQDGSRSFTIAIVVVVILLILFLIGNNARITDDDRSRQLQKMEQTGRDMYK
jgi:predicted nucleic acid-binding Zn ribbon protein